MDYPSLTEVLTASQEQLSKWYRFLPSPGTGHWTKSNHKQLLEGEQIIMEMIMRRLNELGGITPEISKKIGWNVNSALHSLCL